MTALTMTIVLQATLLSTGAQGYAEAHKASMESGQPLLVLVGANWCPACTTMKSAVVPELKKRGILKSVHFAQVDVDRQRALAGELSSAGVIPQLILYRKTDTGWRRWEVTGGQSPESVERFLRNGLPEQTAQPTSEVTKR